MNEQLNALKPLLKDGEYDKATELLKAYRTEFPDDWDGKLMEGILARLKGDDETFRRIHDEAQAVIDGRGEVAARIQSSPLWKKYHTSWKKVMGTLVIAFAVAGVAGATLCVLNRSIVARVIWVLDIIKCGRTQVNVKFPSHPRPDTFDDRTDFEQNTD